MTEPDDPFAPAPPSGAALPSVAIVALRERHDGWTPERQRAFVEALAETGCVRAACAHVGMSEASAYALKRRTAARAFADCWDAAVALGHRRLLETAWERAVNGTLKAHFYHGELIGETREYSDRLLIYLLERTRPSESAVHAREKAVGHVLADWDAALERVGQPAEEPNPQAAKDDPYLIWDTEDGEWRTNFPPPPGFDGDEYGSFGDYDYKRTLDAEELAVMIADEEADRAEAEVLRRRAFGLDPIEGQPDGVAP